MVAKIVVPGVLAQINAIAKEYHIHKDGRTDTNDEIIRLDNLIDWTF